MQFRESGTRQAKPQMRPGSYRFPKTSRRFGSDVVNPH